MSNNKNKKASTTLNYIEHFLTLVFAITVCIPIFSFASLIDISKAIIIFTIRWNVCTIIARIKNYKSITKKNKKKYDKIALLAKTNLDSIKGLISRSLTNSFIEQDYFNLIDVLRKYNNMKEEINKLET